MIDSNYYDLATDGTWIDHLRARLPYSFNRIEEREAAHPGTSRCPNLSC